jgi:hypothetical protein
LHKTLPNHHLPQAWYLHPPQHSPSWPLRSMSFVLIRETHAHVISFVCCRFITGLYIHLFHLLYSFYFIYFIYNTSFSGIITMNDFQHVKVRTSIFHRVLRSWEVRMIQLILLIKKPRCRVCYIYMGIWYICWCACCLFDLVYVFSIMCVLWKEVEKRQAECKNLLKQIQEVVLLFFNLYIPMFVSNNYIFYYYI